MDTFYEPHPQSTPDSPLWNVTLPTGATLPMAVSEEQLQASGALPKIAPQSDQSLASNDTTQVKLNPNIADVAVAGPAQAPPKVLDIEQSGYTPLSSEYRPKITAPGVKPEQVVLAKPSPQQEPEKQAGKYVPTIAEISYALGKPTGATKAHMEPVSEERQFKPYDQAAQEDVNQAQLGTTEANFALAEAKKGEMLSQAQQMQQLNAQREQQLAADQAQRAKINAEINDRTTAIDQRRQALAQAPELDQTRYFKRIGTGGTMLAAIFAGLGSFAEGMHGGPNQALAMLNNGIERDLQSQREELQRKGEAINGDENSLARFIQIHGDPVMAEKEFRIQAMDIAERKAQALALRSQSDQVMQNFDIWRAQVNEQRQKELAELKDMAAGQVVRKSRFIAAKASGYSPGSLAQVNQYLEAEQKRKALGKEDEQKNTAIHMGKDFVGNAPSEGEAKDAREYLADARTADQLMGELLASRKNWEQYTPFEREKLVARSRLIATKLRAMESIPRGMQETIDDMVPANANARLDPSKDAVFEETRRNMRMSATNKIQGLGIPVDNLPWPEEKY